ncbi:MAG: hypothetical protein ABI867_27185 [Kofleriaceae bacterium]
MWNNRTGKPARRQIRPITLSAWSSVFALPSPFRATSLSRMADIRLSASYSADLIGIVRRVQQDCACEVVMEGLERSPVEIDW